MATKVEKRVSAVEGDVKAINARDDEREKHRDKWEKSVSDKFGVVFDRLDNMPQKLLEAMKTEAQQADGKIVNRVLVWTVGILIVAVAYLITQGAPWAEAHAETVTLEGVNYVFSRK